MDREERKNTLRQDQSKGLATQKHPTLSQGKEKKRHRVTAFKEKGTVLNEISS